MTRSKTSRNSLGALLAVALGALALIALPGVAAARDRNHDHLPDRWEKRHHLSLKVNQAHRDQDGDHMRNRAEFLAGDNPRDRDSDDDGVIDGEERAGTIQSFDADTGRLVIDLFGNGTVVGLVDGQTQIKCEGSSAASTSRDGESGGDNSGLGEEADVDGDRGEEEVGDDHGGEAEPGDDDGGRGEQEPGDDHGNRGNCGTAALVPGAVVEEAELELSGGQATFEEVELSGRNA